MDWFLNLKIENQIAIVSSFATIFISIGSVWIALKAMKITKQSTLDANRPYVVIYFEVVDVGYYVKYLIIKNYGKSGAFINSIECDKEFKKDYLNNFLDDCSNRFIAPGQSFVTVFDKENEDEQLEFDIKYSDNISKYNEKIQLNSRAFKHQMYKTVSQSKLSDFENRLIQTIHAFKKSNL